MVHTDLIYLNTIEQKGNKWLIYGQVNQQDPEYIDIWVQKEGLGVMDMVIGVECKDGWRDIVAGPIIDFINSTEGDPRYE